MNKKLILGLALSACTAPSYALNILLSNDDGMTSNVLALYSALKTAGHDVIVSVPCTGQSGMGAAIKFLQPITPLEESCLNNAGLAGDAGAGPVTKIVDGVDYSDFYYVNGTPIMATAYGLDVQAQARWASNPDLVLSGPNEGQNVGGIVVSSGTVSNVQFAMGRGIPSIALSAGTDTEGEEDESGNHSANPLSDTVAQLTLNLIDELSTKAGSGAVLPSGLSLNVNFPDGVEATANWEFSEIGTYNQYDIKFVADLSQDPVAQGYGLGGYAFPGMTISFATTEPTAEQADDESVVFQNSISVTAMRQAYDHTTAGQEWMRLRLRDLIGQ